MENQFTESVTMSPVSSAEDTTKQAKKHFSKLGLMFFFGTLIINGVQIASTAIAELINPALVSDTDSLLLVTMLPTYIIAMPLTALLLRMVPATTPEKKRMSVGQWFIALLICYAGMYVSNLIGLYLTQFIGVIKGSAVSNTIVDIASNSSLFVNFFLMVVCAPVAEELLFRKLLIDRTAKYGEAISVVISGLMFGLFHGNLNQFIYAFTLGVFFGFIYVKTGKIIYSILLHMVINFMGSVTGILLLNFLGDDFVNALNDPALLMSSMGDMLPKLIIYMVYAFALLAIVIAGIVLLIVNIKKIHFLPGEITIPKGKRFSTIILNVGMILFILFWIIMIIVQLLS